MKVAKFKTDSNRVFYYDNDSNLIYDDQGTKLTWFPQTDDYQEYAKFAQDNYATRKKSKTPTALRILMGHACNYSCSYCMQKDIGNPDELPKRKNLDNWFNDVTTQLDLTNLNRIELWGGEPFLYWNDMVPLMTFFDRPGLTFAISTNGSCLSAKHAEFFAGLQSTVIISISHDGPRQLQLRGEEILNRPRVIQTLKQFDQLPNVKYAFQCSVTNTNYDLFAINDFFKKHIYDNQLDCWTLAFSLGRTYQEGSYNSQKDCNSALIGNEQLENNLDYPSTTHVIHGENLEKFRSILASFLEAHYTQLTKFGFHGAEPAVFIQNKQNLDLMFCDIYESTMGYSVLEYSRKVLTDEPILETTNCGADMADILSLDLDGNVRTCPHAGEKYIHGTVNNIRGIRIVTLDLNKKQSHCSTCVNKKLCRSSCPLTLPDETFITNCRVEKVWYGEIQKAAFRFVFNEPVEYVGDSTL